MVKSRKGSYRDNLLRNAHGTHQGARGYYYGQWEDSTMVDFRYGSQRDRIWVLTLSGYGSCRAEIWVFFDSGIPLGKLWFMGEILEQRNERKAPSNSPQGGEYLMRGYE